jgi:peptidoglycan glycosyltransferase
MWAKAGLGVALALSLVAGAARAEAAPVVDLKRATRDASGWVAKQGDGRAVRLTLDPTLQETAQRLLARAAAPESAIVVLDVKTGRVLAWASTGTLDYASTPHAPHASVMKLATATALLDKGVKSTDAVCVPPGGEHGLDARLLSAKGTVCSPFGDSLGRSQNLVLGRLAKDKLVATELEKSADALGLTGPLPIDVQVGSGSLKAPRDAVGLARVAAGFWGGKATPLGVASAMSTIANDGERLRLHVLEGPAAKRTVERRAMPVAAARELRKMLGITTKRGTCAKVFAGSSLPAVGAKTGTLVGGKPARMYSWFSSFAPLDQPEIAVAVMLSNDLVWRAKANQLGRELLEAHFARRASKLAMPAASKRPSVAARVGSRAAPPARRR